MKTINLFFDMEFTSLSPDAQPISLGIVSDEIYKLNESDRFHFLNLYGREPQKESKYFYAEFLDFDINRCDDWVKENVVSKLKYGNKRCSNENLHNVECCQNTNEVKILLSMWLSQFSDYQIQFIGDCCTWDWWFMVQLLAEWETKFICQSGEYKTAEEARCKGCYAWDCNSTDGYKIGLPKLPDNISPAPFDLNDLIAIKKGITPKEAFKLNREELTIKRCLLIDKKKHQQDVINSMIKIYRTDGTFDSELAQELKSDIYCQLRDKYKHNALFDAKVIKEIYNKLH